MGKKETTPAHEYAELFPLHEGQPLWDMSDDIKKHGQKEHILLYDGKILDGRRRELACFRAGVEPKYKEFKGTDEEALSLVISKNLHRRHLGSEERAFIAAKIATMKVGDNQHTKEGGPFGPPSIGAAASMMNVGTTSVKRAKEVLKNSPPDIIQAVESGVVSVSDASKISGETHAVQSRALEVVIKGKEKTLAAAVKHMRHPGDDGHVPPKKKKPPKVVPPRQDITDKAGETVPDHLRDAYADATLPQLIEELENVEAFFRVEPWQAKARSLCDHYGFILIKDFGTHCIDSLHKMQCAIESLKVGLPHAVCPKCKGVDSKSDGKTCRGCRGYGLVPEHRFKELTA